MDGKYVKLDTPVEAFGKTYSELILREPRAALYARLGEPRMAVMSGGSGGGYWVEQQAAIRSYMEALIDVPDAAAVTVILGQLSLSDFIRLKNTLLGFFLAAEARASTEP